MFSSTVPLKVDSPLDFNIDTFPPFHGLVHALDINNTYVLDMDITSSVKPSLVLLVYIFKFDQLTIQR